MYSCCSEDVAHSVCLGVSSNSTMTTLTILRKYASKPDPSSLPASVLLTHTASSLTIFDLYPKSNSFHFLLLPRLIPPLNEQNTISLKALLRWDKNRARSCLESLAKDAEDVKNTIKQEMMKRFGVEWPIFIGFHAIRNVSSSSCLKPSIFTHFTD